MINPNSMIVLAEYPVEEILPRLGMNLGRDTFETPHGPYDVKVGGLRLECLRRNQTCVWCGKRGTFFRLEASKPRGYDGMSQEHRTCYVRDCPWCSMHPQKTGRRMDTPHLNLYHRSRRGALFMLTQDHILPLSRGGANSIENLQTMCDSCNHRKGNRLESELTAQYMNVAFKGGRASKERIVFPLPSEMKDDAKRLPASSSDSSQLCQSRNQKDDGEIVHHLLSK